MSHLIEIAFGSITVIVVSSLVFARMILNKTDENENKNKNESGGKKQIPEIPTLETEVPVRICPYCKTDNTGFKSFPRGEYLFLIRNDRAKLRNVPWANSTDFKHGPSTATTVSTPQGQRAWQMCSYCFAEWYCSSPKTVIDDADNANDTDAT